MTRPLTKSLLGGAAAIAIAAIAFSPSAKAACWWNGYNWNCAPAAYSYGPPAVAYSPYSGYGTPYAPYYYGYNPTGRYPGPRTN